MRKRRIERVEGAKSRDCSGRKGIRSSRAKARREGQSRVCSYLVGHDPGSASLTQGASAYPA